jgi:glycerol-3-phosphate dehydrogenase (NAD(P)+)
MSSNRVSVLGAGAFGTALAIAFARAGRDVTLWGRDAARMAQMKSSGQSDSVIPGARLEPQITPTADLAKASEAPVLVIAIPAQSLRQVCEALATFVTPGHAVISAAKGIEQRSGRFVTEVMADELGQQRFGVLSGPSFAADIARGLPTAVSLAMADANDAGMLAAHLGSPGFRIYHTGDIRGVEIGGAAKNVLAIAAGIVIGMGIGESARAAIVTRGFAELRRFASLLGARPETLMGLSGLGDLLLTASSAQSRNFSLGIALGQGQSLAEAAGGKLVEGAFTAAALDDMARARSIDMPIVAGVRAVLDGAISVKDAMSALMARPFREE